MDVQMQVDEKKYLEHKELKNDLVPSSSSKRKEERFSIRKWQAEALWSWDLAVDHCAICRNQIMDFCIECQANSLNSSINEECTIAWGTCNHAFHFHCISRWLKARHVCPLDNKEWNYQKFGQ